MHWFLGAFKQYATFTGRARRKEYWYFMLFYALVFIALCFIDGMLGMFSAEAGIGVLGSLFALVALLPNLAVTVRRLHDTDRSGWWILISLVPLLGFVIFVFLCLDSKPGENRFGRNPKESGALSLDKAIA